MVTITAPDRPETAPIASGIRRAILAAGLSNAEAGLRVGVSGATIHSWIYGYSRPSKRNLVRFAQRFGIDVSDLEAGLPNLFGVEDD